MRKIYKSKKKQRNCEVEIKKKFEPKIKKEKEEINEDE